MTKSIITTEYQKFVDLLKQHRQKIMTQKELAERLHKPQSYVSKFESRERRLDVIETLKILSVLKISPIQFFQELEKLLTQ